MKKKNTTSIIDAALEQAGFSNPEQNGIDESATNVDNIFDGTIITDGDNTNEDPADDAEGDMKDSVENPDSNDDSEIPENVLNNDNNDSSESDDSEPKKQIRMNLIRLQPFLTRSPKLCIGKQTIRTNQILLRVSLII